MEWSIIKEAINLIKIIFNRRKKKHFVPSNVFSDSIKIDDIANEILTKSGLSIDCFFVMLAHNGGKKLQPSSLMYRSIVGGDYNPLQVRNFIKNEYINLELDNEYKQLLSDIHTHKNDKLGVVRSVYDGSELSKKYQLYNLKIVRYFFLTINKYEGMYYLMVGTTQDHEDLNDNIHQIKIQFAVNKIRNIIKRYQ